MNNINKMSHGDVQLLATKTVYQGYFRLEEYQLRFRLFSGSWSEIIQRELFERGSSVAILLYDPLLDKVVLTQQFRIGALKDKTSPWLIEIVAGIVEADEKIEEVAKRETLEETGLTLANLTPIYNYWASPGGSSEQIALLCAQVDATNVNGVHGLANEHEDIRVFTMESTTAFKAIQQGTINNAHSIIALQWLQINRKKLRDKWSKLSI